MGLNIAVLMENANDSALSPAGGKSVCAALEEAGHRAVPLDVAPGLASALREVRPDVCVNALVGKEGADGTVQDLLEFVGVPFVGSPSDVCRRVGDAGLLGAQLEAYRDATGDELAASWPQGFTLGREALERMGGASALDLVEERVIGGYPVAVKPACGRSGAGVHRVDAEEGVQAAVADALSHGAAVRIEQWIDGVEVTVPVLGTGWDAYALPPVEMVPVQPAQEGDAPAMRAVECFAPVRPASLSHDEADAQAIRAEIERAALEACRACRVEDLACVSIVWDGAQARVLGVDVAPDLAETAPLSLSCAAIGLSLSSVINELISQYV